MEALVAFKDYLESQGVQLIISLVPYYHDIAARVINKEFRDIPDFRSATILKQLSENGIECFCPSEEIIKNYNKNEFSFFFPNDPHPADLPQDISSSIIAQRLKRFGLKEQLNIRDFSIKKEPIESYYTTLKDHSFPERCDIGNNPVSSVYLCDRIYYKGKPIINDPDSPVLVLGNSFSRTPAGNSLADLITMKSLMPVAKYSISGAGILSSCIQRIFSNPESFLTNKKVIVLHVGTIHFQRNIILPNVKQLDDEKIIINNLSLIKSFQPKENTTTIPRWALQLNSPSVFEISSDGSVLILDTPIQEDTGGDENKDYYVEITYCFPAIEKTKLEVNGQTVLLSSSQNSFLWSKKVLPLSSGSKSLVIKAFGRPGQYIAIGKIKVLR